MRTTTAVATACTTCGTTAPTMPPPYTWSLTVAGSSRTWTCVSCSRDHLPAIERRGRTGW